MASSSLPARKTRQLLQLSRRITELERTNKEMQSQVQSEQDKSFKLTQSLNRTGELLKQTSQPHNYLIETIEQRDSQLDSCQRLIDHLENEVENQKQEYLLLWLLGVFFFFFFFLILLAMRN
jgi:progesterone-induced-blocking factor 1